MTQTAVILAGGLGTRLRSVVSDRPKVLAQVLGRPFLSWLLELLESEQFTRCILSVGYLGEQIREQYQDNFQSLSLSYSYETQPAGTGGAIQRASALCEEDSFIVLNGDSISDLPLREFCKAVKGSQLGCGIGLAWVQDSSRYGTVELDKLGQVIAFKEKSLSAPGYINCGVYYFSKLSWQKVNLPEPFSLETSVLPTFISSGILGYPHQGEFIDIGTPQSFLEAQAFLERWSKRRSKANPSCI